MDIIILHSAMVGASRDLLTSLGVAIAEGDDVTVTVGADTVRIVSKHALAVGVCPAFPGYPAALVGEGEAQRLLAFPASWAAVQEWAADPTAGEVKPTTMSKYEFSKRFLADEMIGILALRNTDPAVGLFLQLMDYAQEIDLEDANIKSGIAYLVTLGKLTQDRATAILTP